MSEQQSQTTSWQELNGGIALRSGLPHKFVVLPSFEFIFDVDSSGEEEKEQEQGGYLQLTSSEYYKAVDFGDAEDLGDGMLAFHFPGIRKGLSYTLASQIRGERTVLFEDASLDAFIDNLQNPDEPLAPVSVNGPPAESPSQETGSERVLGPQTEEEELLAGVDDLPAAAGVATA